MKNLAITFYQYLIRFGSLLAPLVLLIIRLAWGWELFEAGHGHLTHFSDTVKNFQDWHIPMPTLNAYISGYTEMVGGILLMLGLATRAISIALFFNFCVAYAVDAPDAVKHLFSNPDKFIDYAAFPFLVTSLLMIAVGPGGFSIDGLLQRTLFRKHAPPR